MTADKYRRMIHTEHDLVQPQGRLVILTLIFPIPLLVYTSIHFFQEQYVIGTLYTHCLIIVV